MRMAFAIMYVGTLDDRELASTQIFQLPYRTCLRTGSCRSRYYIDPMGSMLHLLAYLLFHCLRPSQNSR